MPKYNLTLSYDGTYYVGWQIQPNGVSIQAIITKALSTLLRRETAIVGAGRTDAGVHALGQCAHFYTEADLDIRRILYSLNCLLPADIRVLSIAQVSDNFHARYSAIQKRYHYHLHLDNVINPFTRYHSFHVPHPVDLEILYTASRALIGIHDFSSFANEASQGAAAKNAVRHLKRLDIIKEDGGVRLELEADGFLYKMVRNIVGTLLDMSYRKIHPDHILEILHAKDRKKAGKTAPPHGLFLAEVFYPQSELLPAISSKEEILTT